MTYFSSGHRNYRAEGALTSGALANSTITLGGSELEVTDDLEITGSGQTIDADGASPVIYLNSYTSLTVSNLTITGGDSNYDGGGIYAGYAANLALSDCTISDNRTDFDGGGIGLDFKANLTLSRCTVSGNSAGREGGGIYGWSDNQISITDSTISGNSAANDGGGIYVFASTLDVTGSTISGNTADNNGGGIIAVVNSGLTLTNSTISGNDAAANGGGIFAYTTAVTVNNSTIVTNHADGSGGGIFAFEYDGTIALRNTLLVGNTAPDGTDLGMGAGGGGGPLERPVEAGNRQQSGAKSLNAPNAPNADTTVTIAASLLGTALSGTYPGNGNVFSDAPGLGALVDNGGLTRTMLPQPGSPAIDAGNNGLIPPGVMFDQRGNGFPRLMGASVDIGAVEAPAAAVAAAPTLVPVGSGRTHGLLALLLGTLAFFGLRGRSSSA